MSKKFRIIEITQPHRAIRFKVQKRFFGTFGWWVDSGYITESGLYRKAVFSTVEQARCYIQEEQNTPRKKITME